MDELQRKAIQDAGYRIISEKPGEPIIVEEIAPRLEVSKIDLNAVLEEMDKAIPLNHRVRPQGKKVQPWRLKEEAKRLSRIK